MYDDIDQWFSAFFCAVLLLHYIYIYIYIYNVIIIIYCLRNAHLTLS